MRECCLCPAVPQMFGEGRPVSTFPRQLGNYSPPLSTFMHFASKMPSSLRLLASDFVSPWLTANNVNLFYSIRNRYKFKAFKMKTNHFLKTFYKPEE